MDKETAKKLIEDGMIDFVEHLYIKSLGYAGILSNGTFVDRRKYPEAIAMQENSLLGIPKPKSVEFIKTYLIKLINGDVKGGKHVIFNGEVPIQPTSSKPDEYFQKIQVEFRFLFDEYRKKRIWQFVKDSRDITLNEWIENLL